jgi:hypothetical protein
LRIVFQGIYVTYVYETGPASHAGLQVHDKILQVCSKQFLRGHTFYFLDYDPPTWFFWKTEKIVMPILHNIFFLPLVFYLENHNMVISQTLSNTRRLICPCKLLQIPAGESRRLSRCKGYQSTRQLPRVYCHRSTHYIVSWGKSPTFAEWRNTPIVLDAHTGLPGKNGGLVRPVERERVVDWSDWYTGNGW